MLPKPALRSKDDDDDEDAPPRMLSTVIKLPPHLAILDEVHIDARYAGSVCKAITKTAEQVSRMHDCRWDIMYGLQFPSGDLAQQGHRLTAIELRDQIERADSDKETFRDTSKES